MIIPRLIRSNETEGHVCASNQRPLEVDEPNDRNWVETRPAKNWAKWSRKSSLKVSDKTDDNMLSNDFAPRVIVAELVGGPINIMVVGAASSGH